MFMSRRGLKKRMMAEYIDHAHGRALQPGSMPPLESSVLAPRTEVGPTPVTIFYGTPPALLEERGQLVLLEDSWSSTAG